MASFSILTVESKSLSTSKIEFNLAHSFDPNTGLLTSGLSGSVTIIADLEQEDDTETFFASWLLTKSPKQVNLDVFSQGDQQKFLTLKMDNAQIASYKLTQDFGFTANLANGQNGFLEIVLAAPSITIGQAPFTMGS